MRFNWEDYIHFAEGLLSESEESCFRSAISRAYYGVFCIARNRKGFREFAGANIHWKVINRYKSSSDKSERNVGRILDKLRRSRNDADYDEGKYISRGIAERAVCSAKYVLTSLEGPQLTRQGEFFKPSEIPRDGSKSCDG